jgi:tetratricopeptide (TPR) repeat protein
MTWTCLITDLTGQDLAKTWQDAVNGHDFAMNLAFASDATQALDLLNSGTVMALVVFSATNSGDLQAILRSYQSNIGCLCEFQAIVCDEPSPMLMAGVFEFGIEQFFASETWVQDACALTKQIMKTLEDPESAEAKTIALSRSIRSADQKAIKTAAGAIGDLAEYDFRLAFAKGKAAEATGDYQQAVDAYQSARSMNKMFRPSASSLGETLLVTGKVDEALEVFKTMEKTNPYDVTRKANIATAYVEKGQYEEADKYVTAAEKLAPTHTRVLEAKAQVLLCRGQFQDALKLMDNMSDVGPFFAAKMNELGIQLSQQGKGKTALLLYQKAHKIVRPELKYKISLNAALACRRLGAYDMALKFIARCQKEYGQSFPKLEKIRESVVSLKAQQPPTEEKAS